jgi:hypothetical protein
MSDHDGDEEDLQAAETPSAPPVARRWLWLTVGAGLGLTVALAGAAVVNLAMRTGAHASLTLMSRPSGAQVLINGHPVGSTPLLGVPLRKSGDSTVDVSMAGYQPIKLEVGGAGEHDLELSLVPQGEKAPAVDESAPAVEENAKRPAAGEEPDEDSQRGAKERMAKAEDLYQKGRELFIDHKSEAAAAYFKQAVAVAPGHPRAHMYLGTCLASHNEVEDAAREYEMFLHLAPDDPMAGPAEQLLRGYYNANPNFKLRYPLPPQRLDGE